MSKKSTFKKMRSDDTGVTLVELLAAIAILSIVVTAFLAFFIQAAETNNRTNELNEATFLAQEEMELVTSYSNGNYSGQEVVNDFFEGTMQREKTTNGFTVKTTLTEPDGDTNLYKVIVTVEGDKGHAKMETRLPFEKDTEK
ncbi:type IV pilus modification PilV family protein [Alkalibacterium kapii]|uniref:Prepilin-type N-terminal cleavage/methylation domain-containing protein n=1 Tax=Alkalibacterium kapii TaxID=426704 RepID=A0A511AQX4_9LACT|nr:prepilin-type N-terminal cleavage/methylation domain-containing protein [Alkalibacterium kapii]GEK90600.1 hypothetical protein AKA01nite_02220 [Alkalibacterium kapii]